jgi:uncharacterized protein
LRLSSRLFWCDGSLMSDQASRFAETVPYQRLSTGALRSLIEDFVTREGTDYGHVDISLEEKVRVVRLQLERGEARITFDAITEMCSIERV